MRLLFTKMTSLVVLLMCSLSVKASFTVSGPTTVCPAGTYQYTASGAFFSTSAYRWYVSYAPLNPSNPQWANQGSSTNSTFNIAYNSADIGTAYVRVQAVDGADRVFNTCDFTVQRSLPSPAVPNGGLALFCGPNETVDILSSPFIPYNTSNPSDIASCLFHCSYQWQAPGGWSYQYGLTGTPNNITYSGTLNPLVSPGSVSNGSNGFVTVSALFSQCSYNVNTSSSALLWVGPPAVNNGQVNGNSASGGTVYVPSGYANLSVNIAGGGTTNWYVANGSGSLSPSGNYCTVNFSNFVRVVVDASNRCGGGGSWTFYLSTTQGYSGYRIAPNPAKDQLSVLMEMPEMAGELIESVELYNDKSKLASSVGSDKLKAGKYDKKTIDLDVKSLPRGNYFLHVKVKDTIEKHQIILE